MLYPLQNGFTALEVAEASDDKEWDSERTYDLYTKKSIIVRSRHHDIEGVVELLSGYIQERDPLYSQLVSVLYNRSMVLRIAVFCSGDLGH